jgi:hypothetical protein
MMMMEKPPERRRSTRHSTVYYMTNYANKIVDFGLHRQEGYTYHAIPNHQVIRTSSHTIRSYTYKEEKTRQTIEVVTTTYYECQEININIGMTPPPKAQWTLKSFLPDSHPILPIPPIDEAIFYKDIISKN